MGQLMNSQIPGRMPQVDIIQFQRWVNYFSDQLKDLERKIQESIDHHQIDTAEKTLLVVRLSNDHSGDEKMPTLVLGINDKNGVEITLEKVDTNG